MKKENIIMLIVGIVLIIIISILLLSSYEKKKVAVPVLQKETAQDIKFDGEKINIYLFWGDGCPHCEELFIYLNSLKKEYGKYYNLYTLEVWNNEENNVLMNHLADKLEEPATGVPYLIIGSKAFVGYVEEDNSAIKKAIKSEYEKDTHYDVFQEYKEQQENKTEQ